MSQESPKVSVIIPVKNEAVLLRRCLQSLDGLDYPKEALEIIVADGLSSDNTKEVALSFGAMVVTNDRQIVASGRNCGFRQATGEIIAFTDADCVFDPAWIKNSIKYFEDKTLAGVSGVTLPPPDSSDFEKAVDFLFGLAEFFYATAHRRNVTLARKIDDIPGCNAIYRREALEKVMPVDENLLTAEDVWMNFCLKKLGYKFILAPDVRLWHYRRNSPGRFLRQAYRFAIGRAQVGKRAAKLLGPYHILAGIMPPLFILTAVILILSGSGALVMKAAFVFLSLILLFSFIRSGSLGVSLSLILVLPLFAFGWSTGFIREFLFPLKDARGK